MTRSGMNNRVDALPVGIAACDGVTPFGGAGGTVRALLENKLALQLRPVLGRDGGDPVPLALIGDAIDETLPPRWLPAIRQLAARIPTDDWGTARRPVIVTSSNFGVGSMYAFTRDRDARH